MDLVLNANGQISYRKVYYQSNESYVKKAYYHRGVINR